MSADDKVYVGNRLCKLFILRLFLILCRTAVGKTYYHIYVLFVCLDSFDYFFGCVNLVLEICAAFRCIFVRLFAEYAKDCNPDTVFLYNGIAFLCAVGFKCLLKICSVLCQIFFCQRLVPVNIAYNKLWKFQLISRFVLGNSVFEHIGKTFGPVVKLVVAQCECIISQISHHSKLRSISLKYCLICASHGEITAVKYKAVVFVVR